MLFTRMLPGEFKGRSRASCDSAATTGKIPARRGRAGTPEGPPRRSRRFAGAPSLSSGGWPRPALRPPLTHPRLEDSMPTYITLLSYTELVGALA